MNSLELFKWFSDIDDELIFDAGNDGAEAPQPSAGFAPVKQPKGGRSPRGRTRAIVIGAVAIVLAAAIVCMILYFTGVFSGEKQVPIYTGMEISSTNTSASASTTSAVSYSYSGDYTGRSDGLDKNNPYGGGSATIESEAASTLQVVGAGDEIYYADAGEDIYIIVKFDNPDFYKIESFVLYDGTTEIYYADYNFRSDSTFERIIVQLNVGNEGGIKEYTISEILYLDDNSVNSEVIIGGDTVVRCGVRASDITYATVTDETTTLTSISFNVNIVDKYSLIDYSKGYAMAILYDGDSIIDKVDIEVGENSVVSVVFENLTPNTIYQYAVVAYYDDLSGSGAALNFLYKNAVYTPAVVLYDEDSITIDQTSISFDYSWYSGYSGSITSLTLTGGGETVDLDVQTTSITGLDSYTDYTLKAIYNLANGDIGTITLDFTTEPKVEINSVTLRNSSIAVNKNGTIALQINAYNPDGVTFNSVIVNDTEYKVSSISTDTDIYVNITVDDQFDSGLTTLNVTAITYTIDGKTYSSEVSADPVTVFVNGELSVESLTVVRLDGNVYKEVDYACAGETLYYAISLDNTTEYDITSVTIDGVAYSSDDSAFSISSDKQTVYISFVCSGEGYVSAKLSSLSYKNDYMNSASKKSPDLSVKYFMLTSSEVVEISTAEDLKNMTSTEYKYYKLMNDISLSSETWVNISNCMYGVFDGNGHTISGLGVVDSYEDTTLYLGLFSYAEGCVINLTMTDVYYNISLSSSENVKNYVYGGAIAAKGSLTVSGCEITCIIQANLVSCKWAYIGGLVGEGSLDAVNSTVTSTISISQTNNAELGTISGGSNKDKCDVIVGGMIGGGSGSGSITNVTLKTNITLEMYCKAAEQIGFYVDGWFDTGSIGSINGGSGYSIYNSEIEFTLKATATSPLYMYMTSAYPNGEISGSTITGDCTYAGSMSGFYFNPNTDEITDSTVSYSENGIEYSYVYDSNGDLVE